jgi:hypothetical protein
VITQRAFFYAFNGEPGLGILAENVDEGWKRLNFLAFGFNADALQKTLKSYHETSPEGASVLTSNPAYSKAVLAGGMVLKGLTALISPEADLNTLLRKLEKDVEGLAIPGSDEIRKADNFNPMMNYWTMYKGIIPGLTKVIFFEYATQFAIMGMSRERDLHVVEELYAGMEGLHDYITIPKPLRTDEYDARSDIYLYIIRNPLKEELQGDYVQKFLEITGVEVYSL